VLTEAADMIASCLTMERDVTTVMADVVEEIA
jgi:hypothetical protein